MKRKWFNKDYLYLLPAVLFVGSFFIPSILYTIYISFFHWDGFSAMTFAGLGNYKALVSDPNFKVSILNTLTWVLGYFVVIMSFPLFLAICITNSYRAMALKNCFYFPTALSLTVGGMIISSLLSTAGFPKIAESLGHPELMFDWLSVPYVNTYIMILMTSWQGIGLNLLLFIGGLRSIDERVVEAAMIDGVGKVRMYPKIILPLLRPTIVVVFIMTMVNSFKVFDNIWIMSKGGPYRTSETLALTMYVESFIYSDLGSGAAVAVFLSLIILTLSYFNLRYTFKDGR